MDRKKVAQELDSISCMLDGLSRRIERLANEVDAKLDTPRKPKREVKMVCAQPYGRDE